MIKKVWIVPNCKKYKDLRKESDKRLQTEIVECIKEKIVSEMLKMPKGNDLVEHYLAVDDSRSDDDFDVNLFLINDIFLLNIG